MIDPSYFDAALVTHLIIYHIVQVALSLISIISVQIAIAFTFKKARENKAEIRQIYNNYLDFLFEFFLL